MAPGHTGTDRDAGSRIGDTIASLVGVLAAKIRFVIADMKPKNMQLVDRGYNERKVQLQALIETSQRWHEIPPTEEERARYRRDALTLVADYVRDHRARFGSRRSSPTSSSGGVRAWS